MQDINVMIEPVRAFLQQIGFYLPRIALAVLIVIGGWLLAKTLRFGAVRGLRAINFNVLTERAGFDGFLRQVGIQRDAADLFGMLVYGLVLLGALLIAFNGLGLTYVTDLLQRVVWFLPRVFVALLVLIFGAYFARFVGSSIRVYCQSVDMPDAELLGRLAQYAIMAFVILIALEQLAIGGDIVRHTFLILLAGVVLALALAFGLGGRAWAGALLERWWPTTHLDESRDGEGRTSSHLHPEHRRPAAGQREPSH
ncbi:MAG TPA: hypothetical protein VFR86_07430 [Burkholderiaceae bacterium]|nr:hypothetical protein [Burkholderiaceae bacterium]